MPVAKLTEEQKLEIHRRWLAGETQDELAAVFSVCQTAVSYHLRKTCEIDTAESWSKRGGRRFLQRAQVEAVTPFTPPQNPPRLEVPHEVTRGEATRFWEKATPPNRRGCRLWLASISAWTGYGCFSSKGQSALAHRVSWRLTYGPIPPGKQIAHACDTHACVEPTHLWAGTGSENMRDMAHKKRGGVEERSKLTWAKVRQIRKLRESGHTVVALAERFRISKAQVSNIIRGEQWKE